MARPQADQALVASDQAQGLGPSGFDPSRFYVDCEFDGHGGQLLSMALVGETGRCIYLCVADAPEFSDPWVAENVWPLVHARLPIGRTVAYVNDWGPLLKRFIGETSAPTFVADSPVDIGRFCQVLSTGSDGRWSSAGFPAMHFEVHNVDCYPTDLAGAVQHNAYWDAVALRRKLNAIATEARRAETAKQGSVHEGAGRNGIAQS